LNEEAMVATIEKPVLMKSKVATIEKPVVVKSEVATIEKPVVMKSEVATESMSHCESRASIVTNEATMKTAAAASESPARRGSARRSRDCQQDTSDKE